MATTSMDTTNGRYRSGGTTSVSGNNITWWERKVFQRSDTDIAFPITKQYALRPDLIAHSLYGKSSLSWVVLQYNSILDVNEELVEGVTIILPTRTRLFGELLKK